MRTTYLVGGFVAVCILIWPLSACRSETTPTDGSGKNGNLDPGAGGHSSSSQTSGSGSSTGGVDPSNPSLSFPKTKYATAILLSTECVNEPFSLVAPKMHQIKGMCEEVTAKATQLVNGNSMPIETPLLWTVADPSVSEIVCDDAPQNHHCWPLVKKDIFDGDEEVDPETSVSVCAINTCPKPRPEDCNDLVCTSFSLTSAVNIEGGWWISGTGLDGKTSMYLHENGRLFQDPWLGIKQGEVDGASVDFHLDDSLYSGTISSDRRDMQGQVLDLIGNQVIGTWKAHRFNF